MQNIIRYSAEQLPATANMDPEHKSGDLRYGILTIGQEGSDYVVHSGNLIRETDVAPIRERLTAIQAMTPDQLKAAYKDQLKGTPGENSKGAGIGLIEIARRASRPIEFDFSRIDNENFFFALTVGKAIHDRFIYFFIASESILVKKTLKNQNINKTLTHWNIGT